MVIFRIFILPFINAVTDTIAEDQDVVDIGRGAISIGILVVQVQFAVLQQLCTVEMTRFVGNGTDRFGAVSRFYPDLVVVFENQL